jgi:hypothetical protein
VSIPDLVDLKKTQRPRDYPIISRLVLARMKEREPSLSREDLTWASHNIFSLPECKRLLLEHPDTADAFDPSVGFVREAAQILSRGEILPATIEDQLEDWLDAHIAPLRKADRHFWRPVIDELRQLRAQGKLLAQGTPV